VFPPLTAVYKDERSYPFSSKLGKKKRKKNSAVSPKLTFYKRTILVFVLKLFCEKYGMDDTRFHTIKNKKNKRVLFPNSQNNPVLCILQAVGCISLKIKKVRDSSKETFVIHVKKHS